MSLANAPSCDVTLLPEMVALLRGEVGRAPADTGLPVGHPTGCPTGQTAQEHGPAVAPAKGPPEVAGDRPSLVRLRVDGARPLVFRGALLCRSRQECLSEDPGYSVDQNLGLYLGEGGSVYGQVVAEPSAPDKGRAVYGAMEISTPEDLAHLIRSAAPERCFSMGQAPRPGMNPPRPTKRFAGIAQDC